jgi:hypothetical protein
MSDPIYDTIAAISVTGATNVYNLAALPANPGSPDLPCRLLLPFGAGDNESNMVEFIAGGHGGWVQTKVVDLFLLRHAAEGEGIHTAAPDIVAYARAYWKAMLTYKHASETLDFEITGITAKPGLVEYPSQSGIFYHGVLCTLTVREVTINT